MHVRPFAFHLLVVSLVKVLKGPSSGRALASFPDMRDVTKYFTDCLIFTEATMPHNCSLLGICIWGQDGRFNEVLPLGVPCPEAGGTTLLCFDRYTTMRGRVTDMIINSITQGEWISYAS